MVVICCGIEKYAHSYHVYKQVVQLKATQQSRHLTQVRYAHSLLHKALSRDTCQADTLHVAHAWAPI